MGKASVARGDQVNSAVMLNSEEKQQQYALSQHLRDTFTGFIRIAADPSGSLSELQQLVDKYLRDNSDVNLQEVFSEFRDSQRRTLLHFAAQAGNIPVTQWILDNMGARDSADVENEQGVTPLMLAAQAGHQDVVRLLLQRAADVNHRTKDGATAVHYAAASAKDVEALRVLCENHANLTLESKAGTPLHWAAGEGNAPGITVLLETGADVNATNAQGLTPVIMAAASGSDAATAALVRAGADIGAVLTGGLTSLHICAEMGCEQAVEAMLETETGRKCAQLESDAGKRPIHLAAAEGHRSVVEKLLPYSGIDTTADELMAAAAAEAQAQADAAAAADAQASSSENNAPAGHSLPPAESTDPAATEEATQQALQKKDEGNTLYAQKKYAEAIDLYTQSLRLDGSNHAVWSNRSAAFLALGDAALALRDAEICRRLKPDWPKACYRMAAARFALKQYEDAALAAYEGLRVDPENEELKRLLQKAVKLGRAEHQASLKR